MSVLGSTDHMRSVPGRRSLKTELPRERAARARTAAADVRSALEPAQRISTGHPE